MTLRPIEVLPGVQPETDMTPVSTSHYTYADKIRDFNGKPQKIGGWESISFDYNDQMQGYVRSIYTDFINGKYYTVLGSNKKLYSLIGSRLTNITPLQGVPSSIPNSLSTHYDTLASNPIEATIGQDFVWINDPDASNYVVGDTIIISGATNFAGLTALNGDFLIREIQIGKYRIFIGQTAISTATGGGAAVVRTSGLLTVTKTAHGLQNGDRIALLGAVDTGGILEASINDQFIIRNVSVNTFDVMTNGQATSSVTSAGGADTELFVEISAGQVNETNAQGYGAGLYGVGLYGTALISNTTRSYPRIWFDDRFGNTIVMTPGNQGGLYQWFGDVNNAPELVQNAPTQINYAFVSNNIVVTFGAGGIENRIYASDQNNITEWSSSSVNQVYDDDIEGAGRLISHCPVKDYNIIFTEHKCYLFRYIGLPFVWSIQSLDESIGLIAPMARCSVKGMAFWMGQENFYFFRGGTVEIIPANSQSQSTCLKYVFDNLNWGQKSKIFAWYNKQFNEVWFHYPDASSNEPNRVVRVNILTFSWWIDTMDRTAAEYPSVKLINPRLTNINTLYQHEFGNDADGQPMPFVLTSNRKIYDKSTTDIIRVYPDSSQAGVITFNTTGYLYPQSIDPTYNEDYIVGPTTLKVEEPVSGRFFTYSWSGNDLGQNWKMGTWFEEIQKGSNM